MTLISVVAGSSSYLNVYVTPRSGRDCVAGYSVSSDLVEVHVKVTAPPDEGKANKAVVKVLADALDVPKSHVSLVVGDTSRHKKFQVPLSGEEVLNWVHTLPLI